MTGMINISSGEDVMQYEPSSHHTYESFKERQRIRAARAANTMEGSVIIGDPAQARPKVILLRDESGFGPPEIPTEVPATLSIPHDGTGDCCGFEPITQDQFDEALGG